MRLTKTNVYMKIGNELIKLGRCKTIIIKNKKSIKGKLIDGREVKKINGKWIYEVV